MESRLPSSHPAVLNLSLASLHSGHGLFLALWAADRAETQFLGEHHSADHGLYQCCRLGHGWQFPGELRKRIRAVGEYCPRDILSSKAALSLWEAKLLPSFPPFYFLNWSGPQWAKQGFSPRWKREKHTDSCTEVGRCHHPGIGVDIGSCGSHCARWLSFISGRPIKNLVVV